MEENKIKNPEFIDLRMVFRKIWDNRKLFYKVLPIVFVLSCIYIFSIPRYYTSEVKLAPELENSMNGGGLSALASSFGFDLSEMQTTDAITPLLYPDLMEDNGFVYSLMGIQVESQDGEIKANYHDYLQHHQKVAWWVYPISWLKNLLPKAEDKGGSKGKFDPYNIGKKENDVYEGARDNINVSVDKKTGVITIVAKAQDPLVCKTLADSIKDKLQVFITEYRTNKARIDYEYYKKLTAEAKQAYEKASQRLGSLSDANSKVALQSVAMKGERLRNDLLLKQNAYTTVNTQLQAAKAKVQERTPAFTVLKGAAVPVKPAGPKRILFIAEMLFLACFGVSMYILKAILKP